MIPGFPNGKLWLSTEPLRALSTPALWSENGVNVTLLFVCIALIIIFLRDFFILWNPILRCLALAKPNTELEYNIQLARTRNRVAIICSLLLLLICDRFSLLASSLWLSAVIIAGYILIHSLMASILSWRRVPQYNKSASQHIVFTYGIVLSVLMALTSAIWLIARWSEELMRLILVIEAGAVFLLLLLRQWQILRLSYRPFLSFLYLCSLELVPAAALVAMVLLN